MKLERVEELLRSFPSKRVLVIGDLMLDEFVWGRVSRISPEAPVPVVEVIRESYYPGGAANVARNVREFTPSVFVMGVIGEDSHAQKLRNLLAENGIGLDAIQHDKILSDHRQDPDHRAPATGRASRPRETATAHPGSPGSLRRQSS